MSDGDGCGILILVLFVMFIVAYSIVDLNASYCNKHTETIVVTNKSAGSEPYLIYTDKQVYQIQSLVWEDFYTASELYNRIHVGDTLKVTVVGRRQPVLGMYKNIIEIRK